MVKNFFGSGAAAKTARPCATGIVSSASPCSTSSGARRSRIFATESHLVRNRKPAPGNTLFAIVRTDAKGDSSTTPRGGCASARSTVTAAPSERPKYTMSSGATPSRSSAARAPSASLTSPASEGVPSLRPYPR